MTEHQNIEYKISWRDEYLKWVGGFANAQGGKIFIGIDDNGKVTGVDDYKKLMDDIPNKAVNHLGLVVDVNLHQEGEKYFIEIEVPVSSVPISYHGVYYYRSGSTKQELKGVSLQEFLLKKMGRTWDDLSLPTVSINELSKDAVSSFLDFAIKCGRVPTEADRQDNAMLLKNLRLVTEKGELKNAALLLFGKDPMKFFLSSYFKIGRFGESDSDLRFQDVVEGDIFRMADRVIDRLKEKYLVSSISYEGIHRVETLEYPEAALREAILNAIVHRDYADSSTIQLSVYDDKLILWNPGKLPFDITIEQLKKKHPSRLRNKNIAEIFFRAGHVESWGRGIDKILDVFKKAKMPEPLFEEIAGGLQVTFLKDIYTEKYLETFALNHRQIKAVQYVKKNGGISNAIYQKMNNIKQTVSSKELQELVKKGILKMTGRKGRAVKYALN